MADAVAEVHCLKVARVMLSTLSSSRVNKSPDLRLLWVKWMPRIVEGVEGNITETDVDGDNHGASKHADDHGGEELVVLSTRKSVASLLEACIVHTDVQEGHFQAVMTELFEENLGDYTILQIPSAGIKNSVQRQLKVASMCELDWWKRVMVLFLKESRKRKELDAPRPPKGPKSGTPKKIRKSSRRLDA